MLPLVILEDFPTTQWTWNVQTHLLKCQVFEMLKSRILCYQIKKVLRQIMNLMPCTLITANTLYADSPFYCCFDSASWWFSGGCCYFDRFDSMIISYCKQCQSLLRQSFLSNVCYSLITFLTDFSAFLPSSL